MTLERQYKHRKIKVVKIKKKAPGMPPAALGFSVFADIARPISFTIHSFLGKIEDDIKVEIKPREFPSGGYGWLYHDRVTLYIPDHNNECTRTLVEVFCMIKVLGSTEMRVWEKAVAEGKIVSAENIGRDPKTKKVIPYQDFIKTANVDMNKISDILLENLKLKDKGIETKSNPTVSTPKSSPEEDYPEDS